MYLSPDVGIPHMHTRPHVQSKGFPPMGPLLSVVAGFLSIGLEGGSPGMYGSYWAI